MDDSRSEAARQMGRAKTPKKAETSAANGRLGGTHPATDAWRQAISEGQKRRWAERKAALRVDLGAEAPERED